MYFVNQRGYRVRTHHCENRPMTMAGLTEVLMPTERKHEYCRMMGVLKFSKPALGQKYHYINGEVSASGLDEAAGMLTATMNGKGRKTPMARQIGTMW